MISAEDLAKMLLSGKLQSSTLAALKDLSNKLGVTVDGCDGVPHDGPAPSCASGTKPGPVQVGLTSPGATATGGAPGGSLGRNCPALLDPSAAPKGLMTPVLKPQYCAVPQQQLGFASLPPPAVESVGPLGLLKAYPHSTASAGCPSGPNSPAASPPAIVVGGGPRGGAFGNMLDDVLNGIENGVESAFQNGPPAQDAWGSQQLAHEHHIPQPQQLWPSQAAAPPQYPSTPAPFPSKPEEGCSDSSVLDETTSNYSHSLDPSAYTVGGQGTNAGAEASWEQFLEMDNLFDPAPPPTFAAAATAPQVLTTSPAPVAAPAHNALGASGPLLSAPAQAPLPQPAHSQGHAPHGEGTGQSFASFGACQPMVYQQAQLMSQQGHAVQAHPSSQAPAVSSGAPTAPSSLRFHGLRLPTLVLPSLGSHGCGTLLTPQAGNSAVAPTPSPATQAARALQFPVHPGTGAQTAECYLAAPQGAALAYHHQQQQQHPHQHQPHHQPQHQHQQPTWGPPPVLQHAQQPQQYCTPPAQQVYSVSQAPATQNSAAAPTWAVAPPAAASVAVCAPVMPTAAAAQSPGLQAPTVVQQPAAIAVQQTSVPRAHFQGTEGASALPSPGAPPSTHAGPSNCGPAPSALKPALPAASSPPAAPVAGPDTPPAASGPLGSRAAVAGKSRGGKEATVQAAEGESKAPPAAGDAAAAAAAANKTKLSEAAAQALQEYKDRMSARQKRGRAMDTQSVAARKRRAVISQGVKRLQAVIPGGKSLDTAKVLDRSVEYVMFLEQQLLRISEEKGSAILAEFEAAHKEKAAGAEDVDNGEGDEGLDF